MKRQRGRGRKPSNPSNRSYESNGPDVKIRGNANQVYEKYLQYGRDAQTSGDRIAAEAYFQHAEHYFRIMAANAPKDRPQNQQDDQNNASDDDRRDDQSENDARSDDRNDSDDNSKSVDALQVVDGEGQEPEEIKSEDSEPKKTSSRSRSSSSRSRSSRSRSSKSTTSSSDENGAETTSASAGDDDAGLRSMMARSAAPDLPPEQVEQADS